MEYSTDVRDAQNDALETTIGASPTTTTRFSAWLWCAGLRLSWFGLRRL